MMIKPIETKYKGYRFRSRLEARWAVFFDALGAQWEYEKEGYDLGKDGWYLPDFWLPELQCWVEIKPVKNSFDSDLLLKLGRLSDHLQQPFLCLSGTPGVDLRHDLYFQGFRLFLLAGHRESEWPISERLGGTKAEWLSMYNVHDISYALANTSEYTIHELFNIVDGARQFSVFDRETDGGISPILCPEDLREYLMLFSEGHYDSHCTYVWHLYDEWRASKGFRSSRLLRMETDCSFYVSNTGLAVKPFNHSRLIKSILPAIDAARSARFEHGEIPNPTEEMLLNALNLLPRFLEEGDNVVITKGAWEITNQ